jgi:hypothetical protein
MLHQVNRLLSRLPTVMFSDERLFTVHDSQHPCGREALQIPAEQAVLDAVSSRWPKQKQWISFFKPVLKHDLIDENLFFKDPQVHVLDFCSFLNNSFPTPTPDPKMIKLFKLLQHKGIRAAKIAVKNKTAQKYLT